MAKSYLTERSKKTTCSSAENHSHPRRLYLIEGLVLQASRACSVDISLNFQDGCSQIVRVLVSSKGRVQELTVTTSPISKIEFLQDSTAEPQLQVQYLVACKINAVEYRVRQFWRIAATFFKQPAKRRKRAGLALKTVLRDWDYSYGIACRFRANVRIGRYQQWYQEFYEISPSDRRSMAEKVKKWRSRPVFQVTVLVEDIERATEAFDATLDSLQAQTYTNFKVNRISSSLWPSLLTASYGHDNWCLVIRAGNRLSDQALYCLAHAVSQVDSAAIVYADHDMRVGEELQSPCFKPDWSLELLRAMNYIGESFVWNAAYVDQLDRFLPTPDFSGGIHGFLLALSELKKPMLHVPAPLWHIVADEECNSELGHLSSVIDSTTRVVSDHLLRSGISPLSVKSKGMGRCHVRYPVPHPTPLVSIIIPTRDQVEHLRCCVRSIVYNTKYSNYEIIIINNQSVERSTIDYFTEISGSNRVRILDFDGPFNYSKINNMAVSRAQGELVCLLNNDTEIISPEWLDEMVGILLSADVGAVGCKLLFGNGTVQHAGDTVGPGGCANHLHVGIGADEPGYAGRALVAQDLSAVTAACLLTRRSTYQDLGGLDEKHLAVAFNDVDYCLRLREAGLRIVWTPHALLFHHESLSRGKDTTPAKRRRAKAEVSYMRRRWAHLMDHDPFYNPNLNYLQADFELSATPNVPRPWDQSVPFA